VATLDLSFNADPSIAKAIEVFVALDRPLPVHGFLDVLRVLGWKGRPNPHAPENSVPLPPWIAVRGGYLSSVMPELEVEQRWHEMVASGRHEQVLRGFLHDAGLPGRKQSYTLVLTQEVERLVDMMYGAWEGSDVEGVLYRWVSLHLRRSLAERTRSRVALTGLRRCHPALIAAWCVEGIGQRIDEGLPLEPVRALLDAHPNEPILDAARARLALMEGRLDDATRLLLGHMEESTAEVFALLALMRGDVGSATRHFQRAMAFERDHGSDGDLLMIPSDVLLPLAFLASGQTTRAKTVDVSSRRIQSAHLAVDGLAAARGGASRRVEPRPGGGSCLAGR